MTNSPVPEPVDLTDPTISAHRLQELAQTHPQQWDEILAHPNVYPGLADWIRNRQAELAATGALQPGQDDAFEASHDVATDDETQVFAQPRDDEATKVFEQPLTEQPAEPAEQSAEAVPDAASEHEVAPDGAPETASEAEAVSEETPEATPHTAQEQAWADPSTQYQAPQYTTGPVPTGQPFASPEAPYAQPGQFQGYQQPGPGYQQPGYGQPQHFGQPSYLMPQRKPSPIDVQDLGTWALFVAGGAAFMSLFGFAFEPSSTLYTSHMAAGGWFILLLMLGTVVLSILQLLKPSRWMRFFFLAVSLGAGFMMFSRAINYIGFFTLRGTNFSVVWLLFMSLVLLAAALVYLAPRGKNDADASTKPPAQQPYGAYGQPGGYPGPQQR